MDKNSDIPKTTWPEKAKTEYNKKDEKNSFDHFADIVIKYKDTKIYKFIYEHPRFSVNFLIIIGVLIFVIFFNIVLTLFRMK